MKKTITGKVEPLHQVNVTRSTFHLEGRRAITDMLRPFVGKQVRITIDEVGEPRSYASKVVNVPKALRKAA